MSIKLRLELLGGHYEGIHKGLHLRIHCLGSSHDSANVLHRSLDLGIFPYQGAAKCGLRDGQIQLQDITDYRLNRCDLLQIRLYPPLADHVPEELPRGHSEHTFVQVQPYLVPPKVFEVFTEGRADLEYLGRVPLMEGHIPDFLMWSPLLGTLLWNLSRNSGCSPALIANLSLFAYARLALLESPPPMCRPDMTFILSVMLGGPSNARRKYPVASQPGNTPCQAPDHVEGTLPLRIWAPPVTFFHGTLSAAFICPSLGRLYPYILVSSLVNFLQARGSLLQKKSLNLLNLNPSMKDMTAIFWSTPGTRYVFLLNFVKDGSFMPMGIIALLISSEKWARPSSSVLVPLRVCPVTLSVIASISYCNKATASVARDEAAVPGTGTSW
ncbi:hypothetical protein LIER_18635 [Lithospermum erythrorhizon]|uniref:Uncharacterized protein n=1 Tax=Lithospermum erythrorhizon TaxID=34254 RepID=A0AAV3QH19_LITER